MPKTDLIAAPAVTPLWASSGRVSAALLLASALTIAPYAAMAQGNTQQDVEAAAAAAAAAATQEPNVGSERPELRDDVAAAAAAAAAKAAAEMAGSKPAEKPAPAPSAPVEPPRLRPDDVQRLARLNAAYGDAMRQALAGGSADDLAKAIPALSGAPMDRAKARAALPGPWSCQMIKMGKTSPLVVYQPFACKAGADGTFEKLTGSQRTIGQIFVREGQLIYAGTAYVAGENPVPYNDLPAKVSPQDQPQLMPDVGVVELTSANRGRIIFPSPHLESTMNVLVLRR